ncbi:hypothetical protein K227x_59690 [Rubripirellula lacrimiformis]|uniref:Cytochrome C n=1 Tax=Rubripirellula lacrimiformis TaxID=1930273 RepID=A0A517NK74_9BACT|nr:cytochrome c [Rubripirellula lacrimiformis]QDT07541.1 hypothetical protein K227x_59690 [Rubripirellula lacrimiformis]
MLAWKQTARRSVVACCFASTLATTTMVAPMGTYADERRAPPPKVSGDQLRGIFFDDMGQAIRGQRPSLSSLRAAAKLQAAPSKDGSSSSTAKADANGGWGKLISPTSIEDEIKRVRLRFDATITTPGAFNSGGYQDARLDLTILATLFAVIVEHPGDVRWKDESAAARDLLARTAFNCKAGSTQVYNEAKLRKADLQDLVSGAGLTARDAAPENTWSDIADRSPLMEYAERLVESLEDHSQDVAAVEQNADAIKRDAELLSTLGEVLTKEGMDEADDQDYVKLSHEMMGDTSKVVAAIERRDFEAARSSAAGIRQRCDACHEQYR